MNASRRDNSGKGIEVNKYEIYDRPDQGSHVIAPTNVDTAEGAPEIVDEALVNDEGEGAGRAGVNDGNQAEQENLDEEQAA